MVDTEEGSFVNVVMSHNLHEVHGYNRMADIARGSALVFLQDDQLPPEECGWVRDLLELFRRWPQLGGVGMNFAEYWHPYNAGGQTHNARFNQETVIFRDRRERVWAGGALRFCQRFPPVAQPLARRCLLSHCPSGTALRWLLWLRDVARRRVRPGAVFYFPRRGIPFQFVSVADYAPYALRASAFREIGGLDEGFANEGECGIFSARARLRRSCTLARSPAASGAPCRSGPWL